MSPEQVPILHLNPSRKDLVIPNVRQPLRSLHLLYHELRPQASSYSYVLKRDDFEQHVELFARMREADDLDLRPEITFDDGHISNYDYALPILQAKGIHARFFITAGWTGQRAGYMGWDQLRSLHRAGHSIGAHGWTHTLLTHCTRKQLDIELKSARHTIEDALGTPITTMSLPGGRFDSRILAACREAGYTEVFTSIPRAEPIPSGPLIGRLNIRGDSSVAWIASLFAPDSRVLPRLERQERLKAAVRAALGDRVYARLWALLNRQEPESGTGEASPYENSAHHQ